MSQKSLFINLKTKQDLYLVLQVARQWKKENTDQEVHVLTWEENKAIEGLPLNDIFFHYINREKISKIKKSQVIPDFHAINELWTNLKEITQQEWSHVFNTSNDIISSTLASVLNFTNYYGVRFTKYKNVKYSNYWAKYLNEVYPFNFTSINKIDLLKLLIGIKANFQANKENPYSFLEAKNAITELKNSKGPHRKVVAFDINSFINNHWNLDEIAFKLSTSDRYIPVFIHQTGAVEEVPVLEKIQAVLGDDIIIIEVDSSALESVASAVDVIISRDSLLKQIAHNYEVPNVQLKLKTDHQESTGYSYRENDIIISYDENNIIFEELLSCLDIITTGKPRTTGQWLFNDIYQIKKDHFGSFKVHINPSDNSVQNIAHYVSRTFFISDNTESSFQLRESRIFNLFTDEEIQAYLNFEKDILKDCSKNLLTSLRNLKEMRTHKDKIAVFISNLDKFFNTEKSHSVTYGLNLLFRAQLESLPPENNEKLFISLENMLFELKSNYKKITNFLENAASPSISQRQRQHSSNEAL